MFLVARCNRIWEKLRPDGPLGSSPDFTLPIYPSFGSYHRLFTVLMMPTFTTQEKQMKIRDMEALGRWYTNALSPNEGFAGTLKPDYIGYHHNSYYASAYTPHALHNAALIQYLLSGTTFALGENHLNFNRIVHLVREQKHFTLVPTSP